MFKVCVVLLMGMLCGCTNTNNPQITSPKTDQTPDINGTMDMQDMLHDGSQDLSDMPPQDASADTSVDDMASDLTQDMVSDMGTCEPFTSSAPIPDPQKIAACTTKTLHQTPQTSQTVIADGVRVITDMHFATRGAYALHGDLHLPEGVQNTGALVVVHGGGWLDCDNRRDSVRFFAQAVASVLKIPTFNIDYRLAQEGGGYPENVMDVKCAVQWIKTNAATYNIDPQRIGVMGTSAGAHLALMVGLTEHRNDLDPKCGTMPPNVTVTLSYSPPTDLPAFVASESIAKEAPLYYSGEACDEMLPVCAATRACLRCQDASPLYHACQADDDPIVIMQAPDPFDKFVPQYHAQALETAMKSANKNPILILPTEQEMRDAGCTPEGGSHGVDLCMIERSQSVVNPLLIEKLGAK